MSTSGRSEFLIVTGHHCVTSSAHAADCSSSHQIRRGPGYDDSREERRQRNRSHPRADYFSLARKRLNFPFGFSPRTIADKLIGANYSDLENFASDIARAYVLALPEADAKKITADKLRHWKAIRPSPKRKAQG